MYLLWYRYHFIVIDKKFSGVLSVRVTKTIVNMNALKRYFKQETKFVMLGLDHPKPSDFYLSAWQTTRSPVPLFIWRTLLFLTSIGIVISSMTFYIINGKFNYWFIYLTHWGLTMNTLATGFAVVISARCYFYGPISKWPVFKKNNFTFTILYFFS